MSKLISQKWDWIPKNVAGIYSIISKSNNKVYIGSTNNLRLRFQKHYSVLKNNKHHNKILQNHCNKYGLNDLDFCVIQIGLGIHKTLFEVEKFWIEFREECNFNLFNIIKDPVEVIYKNKRFKSVFSRGELPKCEVCGKELSHYNCKKCRNCYINSSQFKSIREKSRSINSISNYYDTIRKKQIKNQKPFICLETGESFDCTFDASKKLKIKAAKIMDCLKSLRKSTHGFTFSYVAGVFNE